MNLFNITSKGVILGNKMASVDLGTLNWVKYDNFFAADITDKLVGEAKKSPLRCNAYETYLGHRDNMPDKSIAGNADWPTIYVKDSDYASLTATEFQTNITGIIVEYAIDDTSTIQRAEFNYPANFHKDTKLPATIVYNPEWYPGREFLINNVNDDSIPIGIKKVGTHVYIQGSLVNCRSVGNSTDIFMVLPEPIRPAYTHFALTTSTTRGYVGAFVFYPDGRVELYEVANPANDDISGGNSAAPNTGARRFDICTDYFTTSNEPMTPANMSTREFEVVYNQGYVGYRRIRGNAGTKMTATNMSSVGGGGATSTYTEIKTVSGYAGSGYICLDGPIYVPMGKTYLKAEITDRDYNHSANGNARLFLIDKDETTATLASNSSNITFSGNYVNSVKSGSFNLTGAAYTDYTAISMTIPTNFDYTRPVFVGVSFGTSSTNQRYLRCRKIWFE